MRSVLLFIDAVINVALGALLLAFPAPLVALLGVPPVESTFYPSVLGAVLIGIGVALLVEQAHRGPETRGLGLIGAVSINLSGGTVLVAWLVAGSLALPTRGTLFLWTLAAVLVGLSLIELVAERQRMPPGGTRQ